MAETRAQLNRKVRQEALRDQLSNQKHIEKVIENLEKLANLADDLDATQVQRLKSANDGHLKLINKYLPDLKMTEITGDPDAPAELRVTAVVRRRSDNV